MKGNQAPEIRFSGFIDSWEQRELNELVTPIVREVPKPNKPYKRISIRSHAKGTFQQKVDDPKSVSMKKLYVVKENDLIVNITFAWEHAIAIARIEDEGLLVSHRFPTFIIDKSDINFIRYSIIQEKFRRKLELISPGGAGRNRVLNKREFIKLKVNTPNQLKEQTNIGKLFNHLDRKIIITQQELDILKQTKEGFLQKMFPKEGLSVPEVRLTGFTKDWDANLLGDILNINSGRDYKHLQEGNIPVYGTGGYMLSVNDKLSNKNAIGIGRKGTINKPQLLKAPFWTVDTLFFMTTKEKNNLYFCYTLANKIQWKKFDESTGVPSLSKKNIEKISVNIPALEEQTKIGNFFKQLDETIALHQQELDLLQETKKAFLQKMFI